MPPARVRPRRRAGASTTLSLKPCSIGSTAAQSATFTADYEITPSLTGLPTHATVMQSGSQQRITIGDVDYFTDGTVSRTCVVGGTDCVDSIDDARVSNLNVTSSFWGASSAAQARARLGAERRRLDRAHRHRQPAGHVSAVDLPATAGSAASPTIAGGSAASRTALSTTACSPATSASTSSIELTSFVPTVDQARLTS